MPRWHTLFTRWNWLEKEAAQIGTWERRWMRHKQKTLKVLVMMMGYFQAEYFYFILILQQWQHIFYYSTWDSSAAAKVDTLYTMSSSPHPHFTITTVNSECAIEIYDRKWWPISNSNAWIFHFWPHFLTVKQHWRPNFLLQNTSGGLVFTPKLSWLPNFELLQKVASENKSNLLYIA